VKGIPFEAQVVQLWTQVAPMGSLLGLVVKEIPSAVLHIQGGTEA